MQFDEKSHYQRAENLLRQANTHLMEGFVLHAPPFRYLATETEEDGSIIEAHQADTIPEIVQALEQSEAQGTDTEINDLETGEVLRPDFERIYRVTRVYRGDTVVYQAGE